MTIDAIQDSWGKISQGGSHVTGIEGQRFADALGGAIGTQVQSIANAHGVNFDPSGLSQSR